ncbi:MAG: SDR family oxidoreductase [Hyphomicrobiales bacterium]|nr:MAG: SDR family oxidoreductase [Hyphomicrobiales bacterium]
MTGADTLALPAIPSFRLDGKRALVTGASRGIGFAAAAALAAQGAEVVLCARSGTALERACDALTSAGHRARPLVLDVTDLAAVENVLAAEPPFQVLVNCAGMARHGPFVEARPADFDAVVNVNLRAAFFLAQNVSRRLIEAGETGSIINVSSQMGHVGGVDRSVYCATKHALEGMTKAMAIELARHGIRVNTLCPTFVDTELVRSTLADPERRAWIMSRICLGRLAQLGDLTGPLLLLASDAGAMMTGSALVVDGGWTAA